MISFSKSLKLSVITLLGVTLWAGAAPAPKRIDVKQMSKKVENVVVPLPNEIFGALNKLGSVNWGEYVRTEKSSNFTERPRIALLLGTVIADGFVAVQAEDAPAVKEIGQRVLNSVVTKHFSADGAELLHQPDLLVHFQTQLQAMPEFNLPIIRDIQSGLGEVKPLVDVGSSRISPESVRRINEITTRLDSGIVTRD